MESNGIVSTYSARQARTAYDAVLPEAKSAQDTTARPALEPYDRLTHALSTLQQTTQSAEDEVKAKVAQKLKDAKEQLRFLRRWGFEPDVIARQAAALGREVAAAAHDLTNALGGNTSTGGIASTTTNATPQALDPMGSTQEDSEAGDDRSSEAQQAYMDVMQDAAPSPAKEISPEDTKLAAELAAIAQQIKALLEAAARKLREQKNNAAVPDTQNLDAAVSALSGTISNLPSVGVSITL